MTEARGQLYFGVDARHLRQLGRELVADRKTALAELVKNAYDADATRVTLHFINPKEGGVLVVQDNGVGMDLEAIRNRWMRLSTAYKEHNPTSPVYARIRAGQKGIGRFAADTLGKRLVLSTTTRSSSVRTVAIFNWNEFDELDVPLEQVAITYRLTSAPPEEHGTSLRIEKLRTSWSTSDLDAVRRAIQLLQPPFPISEVYETENPSLPVRDPGFEVTIKQGSIEAGTNAGTLEPSETARFLDAATAIAEADVGTSGQATWRIRSRRFGIDAKVKYPRRLLSTGPLKLQASYFIHAREAIGDLSVNQSKNMGKWYGGIRVYRDGLRVPPYGDPANDWLGLDELYRERGKVLFPVANNNWFGHVMLSRNENVLLVDTASREGVIENEAFEELRGFVKDVLIDCGRRVAQVRQKKQHAHTRPAAPKSRRVLVEHVVRFARQAVGLAAAGETERADALLERAVAVAAEARDADTTAHRTNAALLDEVALLRILASLGTSIVVFSHEARAALNAAIGRLVDIEEAVEEVPEPPRSNVQASIGEARSGVDRLDHLAQFIEGYASQSRRRDREPQPLASVLEAFNSTYGRLSDRRSARIECRVTPPNLRTQAMARTELDAILINLFTNSLKAFEGDGGRRRVILITAAAGEDAEIIIRFQDTGRGIPDEVRDRLFEPFVTSTLATDNDLGVGTGIGLKIVRDIVEANYGSVDVSVPDEGFSTCFEVRLPRLAAKEVGDA